LVAPIMRARGWVLPVLSEFFPSNPGLLGMNVNHGEKIYLRLRPYHSPTWFFDDEEVVGTMLHELTHNVHGPHNDAFYKYLASLEDEYFALRLNGYSGEGFHSKGNRVGQGVAHNAPLSQAKSKALAAAEQRQKMAGLMAGSGRKLGGASKTPYQSPRELAAEAAVRRALDEKKCASQSEEAMQREMEKAIAESVLDIPDVDVPPSPPRPSSSSLAIQSTPSTSSSPPTNQYSASVPSNSKPPERRGSNMIVASEAANAAWKRMLTNGSGSFSDSVISEQRITGASSSYSAGSSRASRHNPFGVNSDAQEPKGWECKVCTLLNKQMALQCDACGTSRPVDPTVGWTCLSCDQSGNLAEWWTCKRCGTMRTEVGRMF
ncbi:hypothetical protein FRC18_009925, partial [Serendipita sp. 400]